MSQNDRPTFYLNDDTENPVRAGGVLFYRYDEHDSSYQLLLIYSRNKYEDFGGCSDNVDVDIKNMVAREVAEESNLIFSKEFILDSIKDKEPLYIKYSKYILYFVQIDELYDPQIFGNKELHDNIERTVEWVPYENFKDKEFLKKVNGRLNNWVTLYNMKNLFI